VQVFYESYFYYIPISSALTMRSIERFLIKKKKNKWCSCKEYQRKALLQ